MKSCRHLSGASLIRWRFCSPPEVRLMNAPTIARPLLSTTGGWQPRLIAAALTACLATIAGHGSAQVQHYEIDAAQTRVSFEVRTFGIFRERGWFDAVTGTLVLDTQADTGQLDIVIDARSLRARNGALERLIR